MSLLFDEDYDSHTFYDFDRVQDWLKTADAIAFAGTSFAVTLTCKLLGMLSLPLPLPFL